MPQQILFIHGGDVFETYEEYLDYLRNHEFTKEYLTGRKKWRDNLQRDLGENYEVFLPQMPSAYNAKYIEWKIWFEKSFKFLEDNIILIGGSLGGIFLAKYLSENNFPAKIKATFLLAAPYDDGYLGDFALLESLEKFAKQSEKIFLYHSKDDPLVPFAEAEKYAKILPNAEKVIFKDKGHFALKEFPEFVEKLKSIK